MKKVILEAEMVYEYEGKVAIFVPEDWDEEKLAEVFAQEMYSLVNVRGLAFKLQNLGVDCSQLLQPRTHQFNNNLSMHMSVAEVYMEEEDLDWVDIDPEKMLKEEEIAVGNKYKLKFGDKELELEILEIKDGMIYARNQRGKTKTFTVKDFIGFHALYGTESREQANV